MIGKTKKALQTKTESNLKLTKKNIKFIELILKDLKVHEAYTLAGYKGTKESAYQLKHKLKPFIDKYYEIEGVSREGYKAKLLKLLSLPCVDKSGTPVDKLSFNQYKEVLLLLRDELDRQENKQQARPQITAFVIKTHAESVREARGTQGGNVIDVEAETISDPPMKAHVNGD